MNNCAKGTIHLLCLIISISVVSVPGVVKAPLASALNLPGESLRPVYHLTAPHDWLSDPQRPIWANEQYNLYYLWGDRETEGGGWRHATTRDNVVFTDQGMAIDKEPNFPVWTGSSVIDTANTAGFGAGAVVALATQPSNGDRYDQEQYLYYSTDGGSTFFNYGSPVIENPGGNDWFRDPKIEWDDTNNEWVAVIGMAQKMRFFTSPNLKNWEYKYEFSYTSPNIGGMECPDLFRIKASDNTWHWVVAASMQGDYSGKPNTYAYWIGDWNGSEFTFDNPDPKWLDWGMDWYAAVSWPKHDSPEDTRYAIAWMNNWQYAEESKAIPSSVSDDISGQMSIVRELRLARDNDNFYTLLSTPVQELTAHAHTSKSIPNTTVDNSRTSLDYHGTAYEIETDVSWNSLENVGISVGVSADGKRHTDLGVFGENEIYLNRGSSEQTGKNPDIAFSPWLESHSFLRSPVKEIHLRAFVDKGSVELFVGQGEAVHSSQVFFAPGDTGIDLYSVGGTAEFRNLTIREFDDITALSSANRVYEDFEKTSYGSWTTTGTAFEYRPAGGTLPNQQEVTGFQGSQLVNSYNGGDSTTGSLRSPDFTINDPYINFLLGGGRHPRPSDVFADFEGEDWGTGWDATGNFTGQGPSNSSLPRQVGAKVLDTFVNGGDTATGTITSSAFAITRNRINFRIAGGNHPLGSESQTTVNLLVDGQLYRSETGSNSPTMRSVSWDVHDLIGRSAQIQIVDTAQGTWGHLMVDQITFSEEPNSIGGETDEQTTFNLVVNGKIVRTATGNNNECLTWQSWLVDEFDGQVAHILIVDNNSGDWGHINADQIVFGARGIA